VAVAGDDPILARLVARATADPATPGLSVAAKRGCRRQSPLHRAPAVSSPNCPAMAWPAASTRPAGTWPAPRPRRPGGGPRDCGRRRRRRRGSASPMPQRPR